MLRAAPIGDLEIRARRRGGTVLRGSFPYDATATLSDGGRTGRPKKERFAPRAFRYAVDRPERDIHFLSGHKFDRPLASRKRGTLELNDTAEALQFEATIAPELAEVSWVKDAMATLDAGLTLGISPGFRIPPRQTVPDAERTIEEDPKEGRALIRIISAAILFELSIVTMAAFEGATVEEVEARSWDVSPIPALMRPVAYRWRP